MMLPERRPYIPSKGMFRLVLSQQTPVFPEEGAAGWVDVAVHSR